MTPGAWIGAAALLALLVGLVLVLAGQSVRRRFGLMAGRTVALDNVTLYSERYGLVGRPDRLICDRRMVIPIEHKSSRTLWPNHKAQLGVYFLLIEETYGVRPSHGFVECKDGPHRVENTAELREWVLELAAVIRAELRAAAEGIS
jgi:CRISPR-associated exonuclease Cas4